ncbi:MAG TPA: DUF4365 domain-containing protein [Gaiellaceae bacterium]|jgi:hypothetical protein
MLKGSMAKRITNSDLIGKAGVALVTLRMSEMGFLFHETGSVEAGTDGFVELRDRDSGDMLSTVFRVQSKATEHGRAWRFESDDSFELPCREQDIDDWVNSNVPMIVVASDTKRQLSFWKDATSYFRDPTRRQTKRIVYDKHADALNARAAQAIAAVAVPRTAGIYLPPPARREQLVTNLLEVSEYPSHVWVAQATQADMWIVEDMLREASVGVECFLRGGQLYSLRPFDEPVWTEICEVEGAIRHPATEWTTSGDPVKQHEFAELLRRALGEKVRDLIEYDRKDKLFFFRGTDDLSDVHVGDRGVFRVYRRKDGQMKFCRHLGFRARFLRLNRAWYLELNPRYRFTADGHRPAKYGADNASKMKRIERNSAVRQQVQSLAAYLTQQPTLLTPAYRFISFGDLLRFEVPFGFDESEWQARADSSGEDEQLWSAA